MVRDKKELFLRPWQMLCPDLPEPEPEFPFSKPIKRRHRFDISWPEYRVAVEVDGGQWKHGGGRHARDTDREKLNIAVILGYWVFRYSTQWLERDPYGIVQEVARFLRKQIVKIDGGFKYNRYNKTIRNWKHKAY